MAQITEPLFYCTRIGFKPFEKLTEIFWPYFLCPCVSLQDDFIECFKNK